MLDVAVKVQPEQYRLSKVKQDQHKLLVDWADGHRSVFHYIWLRDNCYCSLCGDPRHGEKRFRIIDVSDDIRPLSVEQTNDHKLDIVWSEEGHKSTYDAQWLRQHCYSDVMRSQRYHSPTLWDKTLKSALPQVNYAAVQPEGDSRLALLNYLQDYGICFVKNVPPQRGALESFAQTFGPLSDSNYGKVFEIVVDASLDQKSVANSQADLVMHTDDAYQYAPPGIIFFHCLTARNDKSGQSTFVDGFRIANDLRRSDPDAFSLLCHYDVSFRKHYCDRIDMQYQGPVFCTDSDGNVKDVRISNLFPAPLDLPENMMEPFYAAYRKLMRLYLDPRYCLQQGLQSGDLVMFDNHRILHGRTGIGKENQHRHLRYCSVDRDYFHSQRRLMLHR